MIGWAILLALAAVTGAALWRFGRLPRSPATLLAAMLLLAVAGYAWQGSPGVPGRPTPPTEGRAKPPTLFQQTRDGYTYKFGRDGELLDSAANFHRMGLDDYGIGMIRAGLKERPRSADLWTGLGDELIQQGGGALSPAARYALARALQLRPDHPGPPIIIGEALLNAGDAEKAAAVWRETLDRAPAGAPWRPAIEEQIAIAGG